MLVFVIMPFEPKYKTIYENIIKPSLEQKGCTVVRGDDYEVQRAFLKDIIIWLSKADCVVADLTGSNANVTYEIGLAHAFLKPVFLCTQDDIESAPSNIKHGSRIFHYTSTDPEGIARLQGELSRLVENYESRKLLPDSPVTNYLPQYSVNFQMVAEPTTNTISHSQARGPGYILEEAKKAYYETKDYEKALQLAEEVLSRWPLKSEALEVAGQSAIKLEKYTVAIKHGERLTDIAPLNWYGWSILGDAYFEQGETEEAISNLQEEIRLTIPALKSYAYSKLGKCYERQGNLADALASYLQGKKYETDPVLITMFDGDIERLRGIQNSQ